MSLAWAWPYFSASWSLLTRATTVRPALGSIVSYESQGRPTTLAGGWGGPPQRLSVLCQLLTADHQWSQES